VRVHNGSCRGERYAWRLWGSLLAKLGELLTAKYKLLKEAKGQIMFLKAELETMYVFLKKISDTEEPDEQDKCWGKEVRELSYL
jgi:hypothetical protein